MILLHGIARPPSSLYSLEKSLQKAGYQTHSFAYPDTTADLATITTSLAKPLTTFSENCPGQTHFVTHSMGGLVARAYIQAYHPPRLGRVVMLAPPNQGSEVADTLQTTALYQSFFGPAGQQLTTTATVSLTAILGVPTYPLGIIAGNRSVNPPASWLILPGADDGAVTVSRTQLAGMTDFLTLPTTHTFMMNNPTVQSQTLHFLQTGHFAH